MKRAFDPEKLRECDTLGHLWSITAQGCTRCGVTPELAAEFPALDLLRVAEKLLGVPLHGRL